MAPQDAPTISNRRKPYNISCIPTIWQTNFGKKRFSDVKKMAEIKKTSPKPFDTGKKTHTRVPCLMHYGESF